MKPKAAGRCKTSSKAPDLEKRRIAYEWRLRGYSYEAIGREMGCSAARTYQFVKEVMDEKQASYTESISELTAFELDRIERMLSQLEKVIFALDEVVQDEFDTDPETGEVLRTRVQPKLAKQVLDALFMADKLMERKAKMLGLFRTDDTKTKDPLPWSDDE